MGATPGPLKAEDHSLQHFKTGVQPSELNGVQDAGFRIRGGAKRRAFSQKMRNGFRSRVARPVRLTARGRFVSREAASNRARHFFHFTLKTGASASVWKSFGGTTLKTLRQDQAEHRVLSVIPWVARSVLGRFAAFGPPTRTLEVGLKRGLAKGPGTGLRALFRATSAGYLRGEAWQLPPKQAFVPP